MKADSETGGQNLLPKTLIDFARTLLQTDDAPALVVYETAAALTRGSGPLYGLDAWEPETIWQTLRQLTGEAPSEVNRNKILCCTALKMNRQIITAANVLQNIVLAMNSEIPQVEVDEEADAGEIVWGLVALSLFLPDRPVLLDYEPVEWIARALHEDGFVAVPHGLSMAEGRLAKLCHAKDLALRVKEAYAANPRLVNVDKVEDAQLREQLLKLQACDHYAEAMLERHDEALRQLRAAQRGRAPAG